MIKIKRSLKDQMRRSKPVAKEELKEKLRCHTLERVIGDFRGNVSTRG
jgi:hypothetical protein